MIVLAAKAAHSGGDWWSHHSTLIVGVVGIVFSGFVGPYVAGRLTERRDRASHDRDRVAAHRDDLRALADEAAQLLAVAGTNLRLLREAERKGDPPPAEATEWSRKVFPIGQRLRLRLPAGHVVIAKFETVRAQLVAAGEAQDDVSFTLAVDAVDDARGEFLDAARLAVHAPIAGNTDRDSSAP